ncbi:hypothetical protein AKJ16_DCAP10612 [Drosera capensis]
MAEKFAVTPKPPSVRRPLPTMSPPHCSPPPKDLCHIRFFDNSFVWDISSISVKFSVVKVVSPSIRIGKRYRACVHARLNCEKGFINLAAQAS